jgi:hypothetical protein
VTKNRHPKTVTLPSPSSTFPPYVDKWNELSSNPEKLPKAPESRAFVMNNVLDFAERISFFLHKPYEKSFLGPL